MERRVTYRADRNVNQFGEHSIFRMKSRGGLEIKRLAYVLCLTKPSQSGISVSACHV